MLSTWINVAEVEKSDADWSALIRQKISEVIIDVNVQLWPLDGVVGAC